ncbi:MAG: hypothetical protein U5K72_14385 [Balneolaceae bacterium]|nr:hypothetical protein [Balneolaceae bacterium]
MSRHGHVLSKKDSDGNLVCPKSEFRYQLLDVSGCKMPRGVGTVESTQQDTGGRIQDESKVLRCLDLDEEEPLPEELAKGAKSYNEFKE